MYDIPSRFEMSVAAGLFGLSVAVLAGLAAALAAHPLAPYVLAAAVRPLSAL